MWRDMHTIAQGFVSSGRQSRAVINSQFCHFNGSKLIKKNPEKGKAYWYSRPPLWWSEFLATDTEVPGSIPGATRFSE